MIEADANVGRLSGYLAVLEARIENGGNTNEITQLIREARGIVALLLEVEGRVNQPDAVNVLIAPEWLEIRAAILAALRPYPAARAAVLESLRRIGPESNGAVA